MSALRLRYPASAIARKSRISSDDILLIRKHMFPHGLTCADDALQLIALHRSETTKCPEWRDWFVETVAAYIVSFSHPKGSLDTHNVEWLIELFAPCGVVEDETELELLLHCMELSEFVPEKLTCLLLDQLRLAVQTGEGAFARARSTRRRGLSRADMDYIFRTVRHSLAGGKAVLSRRELAVLDRIGLLARTHRNDPRWKRLTGSITIRRAAGSASSAPWLDMRAFQHHICEAA